MYFPRGGSSVKGTSRPGEIVWSRIYVHENSLHMDIGRGGVVKLTEATMKHIWDSTTPQWPVMPAVLYGVTRDQLMAKHKANHMQFAYAKSAASAHELLVRKAAFAAALGIQINVCGNLDDSLDNHQAQKFRK
jgi:L-fucose isomerase-like protein